ncbi:hypothetical protein D3C80_136220 [compost metagenome]
MKLKSLKGLTKIGAPVERTVNWSVEVTEENFDFLQEKTGNKELQIGDIVDLAAQTYIKRLSYKDIEEVSKAYKWNIDLANVEDTTLASVDIRLLRSARLLGSICEDATGTAFFESVNDVYDSDPVFVEALYGVADSINNFSGKSRNKNSTSTNSGANSQSAESVETESKTVSET